MLEDVRAHVGQIGYPGGCATCYVDSIYAVGHAHNKHNGKQGPDLIVCIGCGEMDKAADHNHILCWECEGIPHLRRRDRERAEGGGRK